MPAMLDLVDIGVNLTHESFDADRDEVIDRAQAVGVRRMVVTGSSVEQSGKAAELAARHPGVLFATAGVHPHHASDFHRSDLPGLAELAAVRGVVAIGECGLDYFRNYSSPQQQERAFAAQLELAAQLKLPVFLHQRDAHQRFVAILRDYRDALVRAVAHCFTGQREELYCYLDMDLHIGITGWICDERRGAHLETLVRDIPADRLMLETDAPYLLPRDLPERPASRRNVPAYLPHVLNKVAACREVTPEQLGAATTRTAADFFALG
jgi:TatD DNase family protein